MCAARIGDKYKGPELEKLRSRLPGYVEPEERRRQEEERGRREAVEGEKKVDEFIEKNSAKLAKEFLLSVIFYLKNETERRVGRDPEADEDSVSEDRVVIYDPRKKYGAEQLSSMKRHLDGFERELAELKSNDHLTDRERERRYARMEFKRRAPKSRIFENFLNEIGIPVTPLKK